jgi:hypothetical protein
MIPRAASARRITSRLSGSRVESSSGMGRSMRIRISRRLRSTVARMSAAPSCWPSASPTIACTVCSSPRSSAAQAASMVPNAVSSRAAVAEPNPRTPARLSDGSPRNAA